MQILSLGLDGGEYPNEDLKPDRAGILLDRGLNTVYRSRHRHDASRTKTLCGLVKKKKKKAKTKTKKNKSKKKTKKKLTFESVFVRGL